MIQRAVSAYRAVGPQSFSSAGTTTGVSVDLGLGQVREVVVALAASITAGSIAVSQIESSSDGTTWSAVPAAAIYGDLPSLNASGAAYVVCAPGARYVRVSVTTSGGSVNLVAAVTLVAERLKTS